MKEYIRMDRMKIYEEDNKALVVIKDDNKKANKSDLYRIALQSYLTNRNKDLAYEELKKEVQEQSKEISLLKEVIEDMNFFLRTKFN